jgi:hypothetical protein
MVFADCELCQVNRGFAYLYGVSVGKIVLHMEIASCAGVYFVITFGISVVLGLNLFVVVDVWKGSSWNRGIFLYASLLCPV